LKQKIGEIEFTTKSASSKSENIGQIEITTYPHYNNNDAQYWPSPTKYMLKTQKTTSPDNCQPKRAKKNNNFKLHNKHSKKKNQPKKLTYFCVAVPDKRGRKKQRLIYL